MELVPFVHRSSYKTYQVPSYVVSNHARPPPITMVERRKQQWLKGGYTLRNERV